MDISKEEYEKLMKKNAAGIVKLEYQHLSTPHEKNKFGEKLSMINLQ